MQSKINHFAVWVVVILHQVIGFLWYSPILFLNPWLAAQGKSASAMDPSDPIPFVYGIIGAILSSYGLAYLVGKLKIQTIGQSLRFGFFLFAILVFPSLAPHYKFLEISDTVLWIDLSMSLLSLWVAVLILAFWRKN